MKTWCVLVWASVVSAVTPRVSLHDPITIEFLTSESTSDGAPQVLCTGGNARSHEQVVESITCRSLGAITAWSKEDIHWSCSASLPDEFMLGATTVSCRPHDEGPEWIVEGSCLVEYELHYSDAGEIKFASSKHDNPKPKTGKQGPLDLFGSGAVFWLLFLSTAAYMVYSIFFGNHDINRGRRDSGPRPGGGHDNNDDDNDNDYGHQTRPKHPSSDWSPVSSHSALFGPSTSRFDASRSGTGSSGRSPVGISGRSSSSTSVTSPAPALASDYGPSRQVTSFGGTVSR